MAVIPGVRTESYSPDRLIAGDHPRMTETVVIASGANLARGALLGRVTTSGKWALSLSAASDGSQTPKAILADDAAAAGADVTAGIYRSGEFDETAVTYGTGHTASSVREGLTAQSIYLRTPVPA